MCFNPGSELKAHVSLSYHMCLAHRLRDLSAEEKLEHHRVKKDLEKNAAELNQIKELKEKLAHELQVGAAVPVTSAH